MGSQVDFSRSFQVNSAMSRGRVVAVSNNAKIDLAACDSARVVGVLQIDTSANAYENPKVRLLGVGTALISVTGCPLTAGDVMVVVTSGQVSVTNGRTGDTGVEIGVLLESAGPTENGTLKEVTIARTSVV